MSGGLQIVDCRLPIVEGLETALEQFAGIAEGRKK